MTRADTRRRQIDQAGERNFRATGTRRRLRRLRARLLDAWEQGLDPAEFARRCQRIAREELVRVARRLPE